MLQYLPNLNRCNNFIYCLQLQNDCEVIASLSYIRNRSLFMIVDKHIFYKIDIPIINPLCPSLTLCHTFHSKIKCILPHLTQQTSIRRLFKLTELIVSGYCPLKWHSKRLNNKNINDYRTKTLYKMTAITGIAISCDNESVLISRHEGVMQCNLLRCSILVGDLNTQ